jgi:HEPN domain-containing protein
MRRLSTTDGVHPEDLVQAGLDHYKSAIELYTKSPVYFDSGGYLMHMSSELILKAWLQESINSFPATHLLSVLYAELVTSANAPELTPQQTDTLNTLDSYERLRYPSRKCPVEVGDEELHPIADLHRFFLEHLPSSLIDKMGTITDLGKGGRVLMKKPIEK